MRTVLYDSHIHLSDPYYADQMPYLQEYMRRTGTAACCVSTNLEDSAATLRLAGDVVLPFVGIHPQFAGEEVGGIRIMAESCQISGIGEIGLDPTYCTDGQAETFEAQLEVAEELDLPVSVHSRKSLDSILETLTSYRCTVLLHWFEGSKRRLRRAGEMGLYVSYGPLAVYAADKRRLASLTRPDRILVETDGPVPFGGCFAHTPAHPAFLPSVVSVLAGALGCTYDSMLATLYDNARSYLGLGGEAQAAHGAGARQAL